MMTSTNTETTTTRSQELETSWQVNQTLVECNRQMLRCHIACDVTFCVGPMEDTAEDISAHKYILVSRSPVFFAMFCGQMAEAASDGMIRVPDVEPDAFRHMLEYLYCDEVALSDELVLPILYIGKKYIIPALTTKCTQYLEEHLHPDNVCLIYEQSLLYDETVLIEKCVSFIETRTEDVLHSSSFSDIPLSLLIRILQFDCLTISELELFQACLSWAQSECKRQDKDTCPRNKRKILGEAIYLVHFPSMSLKEFSRIVARSGILTAEEKCSVFEYLTCEEDCDSHALLFPVTSRQKPQPSILKRFSVFGKSNVYSGDCSIMKLQCDKPVIIKGFGVSASLNYDPLAEIQVTIKQDRTFLCNRSIPITEERSVDIMHVCLPECVIFKANTWYTIIVTFHFYGDHDQGSCRRGKGGSKTITLDGVTFEFDRADAAGFVPQILFCSA